ncbi:MAG: efflux RND transporter permease subunit [Gammaproteobacteria bacterium]|nr:efflux RND transporter permease subunit [Gammaproteobacteria bacterium]MBT6244999.1 efflux RND transporter permease subunit [Gammaproteobacteria bacterium]
MATFGAMMFGAISLDRLGLNLLPELTYPTLTIRTEFEGAAPAEIEEQITRRIEQRVGVAGGVRKMHSISAAGRSDVVLEFLWGTDMDMASIEVREKLDLVRLPIEIEKPVILRLNPNLDPIYRLTLTDTSNVADPTRKLQSLRRFADESLKRKLDAVPGVAAAIVAGGYEDEVSIFVDQEKLAQLDITVQALGQRLRATNVNLSGGTLKDGGQEYLVRTLNQFATIEDIRNTIIFQRQARILRLRDVAEVVEGQRERDVVMRVNGNEAIEVSLYKEGDANTVVVAGSIRNSLEELTQSLEPGMQLTTIYDQSAFIEAAISEVKSAAIQGAFLAVLVLYFFLRKIRPTLIVAATIPASVLVTFSLMRSYDITLNVMSLGGIALAVGMLMDNAIVVLENIARRSDQGQPPDQAAEQGAAEVSGAVLASTLTTIAVFLPLAFVDGIAGQLFKDQALTVTFALLVSLVLALTLIPMLSALGSEKPEPQPRESQQAVTKTKNKLQLLLSYLLFPLLKSGAALVKVLVLVSALIIKCLGAVQRFVLDPLLKIFDIGYDLLTRFYAKLLRIALNHRLMTVSFSLLLLLVTVLLLPRLSVELIPEVSQGEFRVDIVLPPGTRLEVTDQLMAELQDGLNNSPRVQRSYAVSGTGGRLDASAVSGGENIGELNIVLSDAEDRTAETGTMDYIRGILEDIPALQYTMERPQLFTFSTPLEIEINGTNLADIKLVADRLVEDLQGSEGFVDIESTMVAGYPELQIRFDQDRIAALGLTVPDIADRIVKKVRGDVPTEFSWDDRKVDIRLRVSEQERDSKSDIGNLVINPESIRQIRLSSVGELIETLGPADIQRVGQQRVAIVSAISKDSDLAVASAEVKDILSGIAHPPGVKSYVGGQSEEMTASFDSLQFALLLALILVYLVMASLFESLLHPFVIMFTIPLAGIGAILFLLATATTVSVVVFIGFILLVGIVVNNAIVLIDRVNALRSDGFSRERALIEGTAQRMRPILMTTLTTVLGLLPMALGLGEAAELRTPMAITVIGGLLMSTLLTLVVIPVVYDLMDIRQ